MIYILLKDTEDTQEEELQKSLRSTTWRARGIGDCEMESLTPLIHINNF